MSGGHVKRGFLGQVQLHQGNEAVVDDGHELLVHVVGHQLHAGFLNGANAVGLDEQLVRDRGQAQDAPRRAVVVGFGQKQRAAASQQQVVVFGGRQWGRDNLILSS